MRPDNKGNTAISDRGEKEGTAISDRDQEGAAPDQVDMGHGWVGWWDSQDAMMEQQRAAMRAERKQEHKKQRAQLRQHRAQVCVYVYVRYVCM